MRKLLHDEILEHRLTNESALAAQRHPVAGVLEDIRSLYNVGSCFRTADAMLLARLLLCGYTPAPPRREIAKTALGATDSVPWEYHHNAVDAVEQLRGEGWRIYALELTDASQSLDRFVPAGAPVAFVVGNEISGVSTRTLAACDGALEIPMFGVKHSLNVAVAFGIAAWHLVNAARDGERTTPR